MLADELRADRVLVNSVCPGWVATEMGGADAPRDAAEQRRRHRVAHFAGQRVERLRAVEAQPADPAGAFDDDLAHLF